MRRRNDAGGPDAGDDPREVDANAEKRSQRPGDVSEGADRIIEGEHDPESLAHTSERFNRQWAEIQERVDKEGGDREIHADRAEEARRRMEEEERRNLEEGKIEDMDIG